MSLPCSCEKPVPSLGEIKFCTKCSRIIIQKNLNMKILKEYKEPTNIIICGQWVDNVEASLMLTDDECGVDIMKFDGSTVDITTYGLVYIMNAEEFTWFVDSDHYKMHCGEDDKENMYVVLKDYVGVIGATGISSNGEDFDKWKIDDYFYHQKGGKVVVNVTGEYDFEAMDIHEAMEFLISDKKIKDD